MQTKDVGFESVILPQWGAKESANRTAVGDGWQVAADFFALHTEAIGQLSKAGGASPSISDQATILLALHGLHLFLESTALVIRGQLDVVSHLLRGLRDTSSLLLVCAFDNEHAEKFLQSKLEASEARQLEVKVLRRHDEALGDEFDRLLREETKFAHILAHVNPVHVYKAVQIDNGQLTPVFRGKVDSIEANNHLKAALLSELQSLRVFSGARPAVVGGAWTNRLATVTEQFESYMRS